MSHVGIYNINMVLIVLIICSIFFGAWDFVSLLFLLLFFNLITLIELLIKLSSEKKVKSK